MEILLLFYEPFDVMEVNEHIQHFMNVWLIYIDLLREGRSCFYFKLMFFKRFCRLFYIINKAKSEQIIKSGLFISYWFMCLNKCHNRFLSLNIQ